MCRVGSGVSQDAGGSEVREEKWVGGNVGNYIVERLGRVRESASGLEMLGGWREGEEGSGTWTRRKGCGEGEESVLVKVVVPAAPAAEEEEEEHGSGIKC